MPKATVTRLFVGSLIAIACGLVLRLIRVWRGGRSSSHDILRQMIAS